MRSIQAAVGVAVFMIIAKMAMAQCEYKYYTCEDCCCTHGWRTCEGSPRSILYSGTLLELETKWKFESMPCYAGMCRYVSAEVRHECDGVKFTTYGLLCCEQRSCWDFLVAVRQTRSTAVSGKRPAPKGCGQPISQIPTVGP
jgi:hypothetical protein